VFKFEGPSGVVMQRFGLQTVCEQEVAGLTPSRDSCCCGGGACGVPAEMDMGWVHPWVGLGWVKKNGPTYTCPYTDCGHAVHTFVALVTNDYDSLLVIELYCSAAGVDVKNVGEKIRNVTKSDKSRQCKMA